MMIDSKRRPRRFWCDDCHRFRGFTPAGKDDVVIRKAEYGKVTVGKLQWFVDVLGYWKLVNRW